MKRLPAEMFEVIFSLTNFRKGIKKVISMETKKYSKLDESSLNIEKYEFEAIPYTL